MPRIEITVPDDAEVVISTSTGVNTDTTIESEEPSSISDSMRPTPNLGDDTDAKDVKLEDAERKLAEDLERQFLPDDLEAAGVVWRPANSIRKLIAQINAEAPGRSKASDGIIGDHNHRNRNSDHNPWVKDGNTYVVTAVDVTNDPENDCSAQDIVNSLVQSRDKRIKYIIWNREIINSTVSPWIWRRYRGRNPHIKHFHLSVSSTKAQYDDTKDWAI